MLFNKRLTQGFILLAILVVALLARLYYLDLMPLNLDEKCDTIEGVEIIKAGVFNIPISLYNRKVLVLFNLFVLITSTLFINPVLVARTPSIFLGTLTVLLTFALARRLYSNKVGLLSALFLACLPWHIIQSRIGLKIIMVPFFGNLIFYLLYTGMKNKKTSLFLLSFLMLGLGSLYTYQSAAIFIPLFVIAFFILKRGGSWPNLRTVFTGILLFLILLSPLVILSKKIDFIKSVCYYSYFLDKNLKVVNLYFSFLKNLKTSFELLFFCNFPPETLFAPSINYPLLLSRFYFLLLLFSVIYAFWKHSKEDLILLAWLFLSLILVPLSIKVQMEARFLFVILPVPLMLVARFLMDLFDYPISFKIPVLKITVIITSLLIMIYSLKILVSYYAGALKNKEEWLINSFGSQEAARFLFEDNTSKYYKAFTDYRMTVSPYLKYYINVSKRKKNIFGDINDHFKQCDEPPRIGKNKLLNLEKELLAKNNIIYYFLWSPKTHDRFD
jgi:hypothetical protein